MRLNWAAGEKETLQRQVGGGGEKKKASRLPLTEIDLSKLNTRTVVVSNLFFFSSLSKREMLVGRSARAVCLSRAAVSGVREQGCSQLQTWGELGGVGNRSLKYRNYSTEDLGTVFWGEWQNQYLRWKSGKKTQVWEGNCWSYSTVLKWNPCKGTHRERLWWELELCFPTRDTYCILGAYFFARILASITNIKSPFLFVVGKLRWITEPT